jgi:hypothetical protein
MSYNCLGGCCWFFSCVDVDADVDAIVAMLDDVVFTQFCCCYIVMYILSLSVAETVLSASVLNASTHCCPKVFNNFFSASRQCYPKVLCAGPKCFQAEVSQG